MNGKTILVTGGSGFIGVHLVQELLKNQYNVINVSRSKSHTSENNVTFIEGDITNWDFIQDLFTANTIDTCFHLASIPLVEKGAVSPRETLKNNIEGTWNILEAVRKYKTNRLIIFSTAQVYGNNIQVPYKEYFTPRPSRIYETSKTCADIIAQSYASAYDVPVFIARFTNIYGPGDCNFTRIIPKTIRNVLQNQNPLMWGGSAKRDYLYIDDVVAACMSLLQLDIHMVKNRIFNFGGDNIISVKDLIEKIIAVSGNKQLQINHVEAERSDEIPVQYLSSQKAAKFLKWKAKTSLEEGLIKTIAWYKKNYSKT